MLPRQNIRDKLDRIVKIVLLFPSENDIYPIYCVNLAGWGATKFEDIYYDYTVYNECSNNMDHIAANVMCTQYYWNATLEK